MGPLTDLNVRGPNHRGNLGTLVLFFFFFLNFGGYLPRVVNFTGPLKWRTPRGLPEIPTRYRHIRFIGPHLQPPRRNPKACPCPCPCPLPPSILSPSPFYYYSFPLFFKCFFFSLLTLISFIFKYLFLYLLFIFLPRYQHMSLQYVSLCILNSRTQSRSLFVASNSEYYLPTNQYKFSRHASCDNKGLFHVKHT